MARHHILVSPPLGDPSHHTQEVTQDTIGFLACLTSFRLVLTLQQVHAERTESRRCRRIRSL